MNVRFPPEVAVLAAVVFWGISFVATKAALREVSPATLIFLRFGLGAGLLMGILWCGRHFKVPARSCWPSLALMGFLGVFLHQTLQAFGLVSTTAVHTGWLIGLIPIWSALLSAIFLKERFGALKIVGLAGGFTGALLVISQGRFSRESLQLPSTRGDFLILLSTVNWAVYSIVGHGTIRRVGPTCATAWAMLLGWLMLAPLFVVQHGWRELPQLSTKGWGALLFLGIGCSGLGYWFWYGALERIEVSRVASFLYLEPLVTLLAAMVLLKERLSLPTAFGGVVVLLSVLLVQRARSLPKERGAPV